MNRKFFLQLTACFIILIFASPVLCQWNYYINDHLGNTRVVLDENGAVKEYYDYYPFGMSVPGRSSITPPGKARFKFTGKELDDEGGLDWHYFGARYYDPVTGRWLTPDPMAGKYPGLSPYVYAANDPLNRIDPNGEWTIKVVVRSNRNATLTLYDNKGNKKGYYSALAKGTSRNRMKTNADTPHGTYDITGWIKPGKNQSAKNKKSYGPNSSGQIFHQRVGTFGYCAQNGTCLKLNRTLY